MDTQVSDRDGFVFRDADGNEAHFMPCALDGSQRERAFSGALRQLRPDWTVGDTRDGGEA